MGKERREGKLHHETAHRLVWLGFVSPPSHHLQICSFEILTLCGHWTAMGKAFLSIFHNPATMMLWKINAFAPLHMLLPLSTKSSSDPRVFSCG